MRRGTRSAGRGAFLHMDSQRISEIPLKTMEVACSKLSTFQICHEPWSHGRFAGGRFAGTHDTVHNDPVLPGLEDTPPPSQAL
jgi:hypothetical protein